MILCETPLVNCVILCETPLVNCVILCETPVNSSKLCDTVLQIDWDKPALALHNFVRGNDKLPGAWSNIDGKVHIICS